MRKERETTLPDSLHQHAKSLFSRGWSPMAVACRLGINRNTANAWARKYGFSDDASDLSGKRRADCIRRLRTLSPEDLAVVLMEVSH